MPDAATEAAQAERLQEIHAHGGVHTAPDAAHRTQRINRWRYLRIVWFFGMLFSRVLLWELWLRRFFGESFVARGRSKRIRRESRRFRNLAIEMGGVMIKLGQFISSRVDVLPPEITDELIGLQDKVPVVGFDYIQKTIEADLGSIKDKYLWLSEEPIAAASFGQVHRAQLPNGDRVVVKVQRPNIETIVHTDLAALDIVAKISMRFRFISRRANVPSLLDEFARVLWEELDYLAEADHALNFASIFKDDPVVYVPGVYLDLSSAKVLTLEDVTSIKLNDYGALEKAGIDRGEVARTLFNCYLYQIFDARFFHADPHPGNLFVYPIPLDKVDGTNRSQKRPFYLIFIDFGMVGRLTPVLNDGLRETLIAVATQDAAALVASYEKLGVLLPSADTKRIEEATRTVFDKVWGMNMTELVNIPVEEMTDLAKEFSDLLLSMPFQMPQDFIYLSRAVGILSGMCTGLDPQFDVWREMQPFAQRILAQSSDRTQSVLGSQTSAIQGVLEVGGKAVTDFFRRVYKLPALADNVLSRADRGDLEVRLRPDDGLQRQIARIEQATGQIATGVIFATTTLASTLLYINKETNLGMAGFAISGVLLIVLLVRGRN